MTSKYDTFPRVIFAKFNRVLALSSLCLVACGRLNYDVIGGDTGSLPPVDAATDVSLDVGLDAGMDASGQPDAPHDLGVVPAMIVVSPTSGLTTTESGGTTTFTISLGEMPTADVSIALASTNVAEGVVSPVMATFTRINWNAPQTFTVTGADDAVRDGNSSYAIATAAAVSADARFDGVDAADINVTNIDNESPGVTVSRISGLITSESGSSDSFTIQLNVAPLADVTITLSSDDTSEAAVSPASLTFTSSNWSSPQSVTATGIDDDAADGDATFTIVTGDATSTDSDYASLVIPDIGGLNLDDESPGLIVSPTSGLHTSEAGGTAVFTVSLQSEPEVDVSIPIASSDVTEGTVDVATLTFTATNWNVPQAVTVTGADDVVADGDQLYNIVIGPSASADATYNGLSGALVSIANTDDESAGLLVAPSSGLHTTEGGGTATFALSLRSAPTADVSLDITSANVGEGTVAPLAITFTAATWSTPQTITLTGVDDAIADGDQSYDVIVHVAASADANYAVLADRHVAVINTDDETAGVTVSPVSGLTTSESGGTATFTIVLNSQPTADVTIGLSSDVPLEGTSLIPSVVFTSANWSVPQTVTIEGVDDDVADGSRVYHIVTGAASSADLDYNGINASDVAVTNSDNDAVGISVTPTSGLSTSELGAFSTFDVVLLSQPTSNVVINVTSSDLSEGTVSPASLTFTMGNWNVAQTVVVTGADDLLADGSIVYSIVLAPAMSLDSAYSGVNPADVMVTNTDNEMASVVVTPTSGLITTEAGGSATFTVVLTAQPTSSVAISIASDDTSEGTVAPASLTFTMANWNVAQLVTVTGVDDPLDDADVAYAVVTGACVSSDVAYAGLGVADVSVTNGDNDSAGIVVSPTLGLVTTEAGGTATFSVVLSSQPSANVTVALSSTNLLEGTVSPLAVTFTMANWATPQVVTVTGVDDAIADGNIAYAVTTGAAVSVDPGYAAMAVADVSVTNNDNDAPGVTVSPTAGLTTTEAGGTATFSVVLASMPSASVTVSLASSNVLEGTLSVPSVVFTTVNWATPQMITISGVDDSIDDGDTSYSIITGAASSTDTNYNGLAIADPSVTNTDNDTAAITVSPTSGLVTSEAGGMATFTIVLATQPTAAVTVSLASSDTLEGTVSPASVMFSTVNWSTPQTVTVTGVNDSIDDGDIAYNIVTGNATSADSAYNGLVVTDVSVTNTDNDMASVTVSPTSGLTTTEAGGTAAFTIVLASQPTASVTVSLASSNVAEGTASAASVTFTTMNWSMAQMITITGVDDFLDDGNIGYSVVTGAGSSADPNYNGLSISDVTVTNTDNDTAGTTVTPTSGLTTTEAGGTASFTIVLNSQPTAGVSISVMSSNTAEGTVSPASVAFNTTNWSMAQMVTITGVNDSVDDGNVAYTIVTGAASSSDPNYSAQVVADVSVNNTDDDTAGVTVNPTSGLVTTEAGGTATFTVVLTSQPTNDVTISLTSSKPAEGTVSPASLTFTNMNWSVQQTVTVTGVDDFVDDNNVAYTITTGAAASADVTYTGLAVADVSVTNNDDDSAGVTVNPTSGLTTTEAGGTAMFTVVLTSQPTNSVSISLTSSDLTEGTVSPASVTFTTMNWSMTQTVTVTGVDDALMDGNIAYSVVTGNASSADANYNGRVVADVTVTNSDSTVQTYVKASNSGGNDRFGMSVAMSSDGNTLAVGADGEGSNATGIGGNQANNSISGAGAVYIFLRSGSVWSQQAYIKASNTGADAFGSSVALSSDGNTLVVGAPNEASNATGIGGNQADNSATAAGAAYVFTRSGATWTQQAYVKASNAENGDHFGVAAALASDGNTMVVSAGIESSNATGIDGNQSDNSISNAGAVYAFTRAGAIWTQQAYIKESNTGPDYFGKSLALSSDGNTLAVGAPNEASSATGIDGNQSDNSLSSAGAAYVFTRAGAVWTQQAYVKASNTGMDDTFGWTIALSSDGNTMAVGAYGEASNATGVGGSQINNTRAYSGAVYAFLRTGVTWAQQAYIKASNTATNDFFGRTVSLSSDGNTLLVGADGEDSVGAGIGANQSDNSATSSGALYSFVRSGGVWSQLSYIKASNPNMDDYFGWSIAMASDASTIAIGAYGEGSNATGINGNQLNNTVPYAGAVYVFSEM